MSKSKKIQVLSKPKSNMIPTSIKNADTRLVVSYQFLDLNNKKYSMEQISDNKELLQHYKNFNKKVNEYCKHENFRKKISEDAMYRKINHIHPIEWTDNRIKEQSFTSLDSSLMEQIKNDCWQLGIDNQGFRIHGFFIENVFYIVWLDPSHNLYYRK